MRVFLAEDLSILDGNERERGGKQAFRLCYWIRENRGEKFLDEDTVFYFGYGVLERLVRRFSSESPHRQLER